MNSAKVNKPAQQDKGHGDKLTRESKGSDGLDSDGETAQAVTN